MRVLHFSTSFFTTYIRLLMFLHLQIFDNEISLLRKPSNTLFNTMTNLLNRL